MSAADDGGMSPATVRLKEEREWVEIGIECEEPGASLYTEHEVKRELVLGPEQLQPQDIAYAIQLSESVNRTDRVTVKQELVEEGPGAELSGDALCSGKSCEGPYPSSTCSVKLEDISIDIEMHACLTCHKTFVQESSLTSHRCISEEASCSNIVKSKKVIEHCKKKRTFECDTCGKHVTRKKQLITHIRTHNGEKSHFCEICKKQFTYSSKLSRHKRTHTREKPFSCEICEKQFPDKSKLARHMLIHTGEKPFSCDICKKQFSVRANLVRHRLTHTGEKPFTCAICNRRFTQSSNLASHRLMHTGEKPFSCEICKKQFTKGSNLASHKLMHTGEKPYSCDICKKQFRHSSNLASHRLIHSGKR